MFRLVLVNDSFNDLAGFVFHAEGLESVEDDGGIDVSEIANHVHGLLESTEIGFDVEVGPLSELLVNVGGHEGDELEMEEVELPANVGVSALQRLLGFEHFRVLEAVVDCADEVEAPLQHYEAVEALAVELPQQVRRFPLLLHEEALSFWDYCRKSCHHVRQQVLVAVPCVDRLPRLAHYYEVLPHQEELVEGFFC